MEGLGIAANVTAVVDISVKILQVCSQYAKEVKNATADREQLEQEVETLHGTAEKVKTLIESPQGASLKASQGFAKKLSETIGVLSEVKLKLEPPTKPSFRQRLGFKSLSWPFQSGQLHHVVQRIHRCSDSLALALQVDEVTLLFDTGTKLDQTKAQINTAHSKLDIAHHRLDETHSKLDKADACLQHVVKEIDKVGTGLAIAGLPTAAGAAYNSYAEQDNSTCLQNTRSEILEDIDDWLGNEKSHSTFWLQGMAGTGKSTIARTVATAWDKRNLLGASFFFKRGGGDRGNLSCFYTTIASQLAISFPSLAPSIKTTIEQDPSITFKMAEEQFEKLILQPISTLRSASSMVIAIVIDALDECDSDERIKRLITILTRAKYVSNVRVRVFVTSRPELHIRLGFRAVAGNYEDFVLHEIPDNIIRRDIEIFFNVNLKKIREEYNLCVEDSRKLVETWPGSDSTMALVERAVPLFIFAATVCRFISQRRSGNPNIQLQKVLALDTKSQESKMNATYLPPLEQQLEGLSLREQDAVIVDFHRIVGTIILLHTPLTVPALAELIDVPEEVIYNRLDVLHSVLNYPRTDKTPIRLLHLSFRDFLLDPEKKGINKFYVEEEKIHDQIATGCLRILNSCLKEDICNLAGPGTDRSVVPLSLLASFIPMHLQYACRHWVHHLESSSRSCISSKEILVFLETHLLHFIECLTLIGHLSELYDMINKLQSIVTASGCSRIYELLRDIERFLCMNFTVIDQYPLQLYSSLRLTIPSKSLMHSIFIKSQPTWILKLPSSSQNWDSRQRILEGHRARIQVASFSMDRTHMVSLSVDGNLRLWHLNTGECIREIWTGRPKLFEQYIQVSISGDRNWIAIQTNKTVYLWRVDTAGLMRQYELASCTDQVAQLSPCAQYYAFVDASYRLVLLRLDSDSHLSHIHLNDTEIGCATSIPRHVFLSFSPDSRRISISSLNAVNGSLIWDIESRECASISLNKSIFDSIFGEAVSAGLSVDRPMVAFAPLGFESQIQVRLLGSGDLIQTLVDHKGSIRATRFLNDCTILGSSCDQGEIRTWNIETGACLTLFTAFNDISEYLVSVSDDYQMASSVFGTQTLSITTNAINEQPVTTRIHDDCIERIFLSEDAALVATISTSGITQVWDILTGNCVSHLSRGCYHWHYGGNLPRLTGNFEHILVPTRRPKTTEVWRRKTEQLLGCFTTAMAEPNLNPYDIYLPMGQDLAISPNGRHIALVQYDTLEIVQPETSSSHEVKSLGCVRDIMFSSDSSLLLIASADDQRNMENPQEYTERISIYSMKKSEITGTVRSLRLVVRIVDICVESELLVLHTKDRAAQGHNKLEIINTRTKTPIRVLDLGSAAQQVVVDRGLKGCAWRKNSLWRIGYVQSGDIVELLLPPTVPAVKFNAETGLASTNIGTIRIEQPIASSDEWDRVGLGVRDDMVWILWNNTKIFWLPPSFRPKVPIDGTLNIEISGSTVVIGSSHGVSFFIFDIQNLLDRDPSFARPRSVFCNLDMCRLVRNRL